MVAALTFHAFLGLKKRENGDPMGTQNLKKGPHGYPGPQMGTYVGAVLHHCTGG